MQIFRRIERYFFLQIIIFRVFWINKKLCIFDLWFFYIFLTEKTPAICFENIRVAFYRCLFLSHIYSSCLLFAFLLSQNIYIFLAFLSILLLVYLTIIIAYFLLLSPSVIFCHFSLFFTYFRYFSCYSSLIWYYAWSS